ncbi:hypothetical protein ACFLUU_06725 [Chloroflexota bacterium]
MTTESSGNGLDELMRISQQILKQDHEATHREKQNARQRKISQDVLSELRAFSISVAVGQLQQIAAPEIIEQVNTLRNKQGTTELRKLIDNLVYDLEKHISIIAVANPDIKPIERSIKILIILLGLLFSLSN